MVDDVDDVVLSAAEAKALVAGDPDVLRRVQLQTEIVKLEALRAAHLDRQVQARWELKRLPQRIAELQARVASISLDVAYRDGHVPPAESKGEKPFTFIVDGCTFTDRVAAAPPFATAIQRGAEASLVAGEGLGSCPSIPIAAYRGFEITVRPASMGTVRLGLRCPGRSDALEYATARTLDPLQAPAYGTGLFQRLDHLSEAIDGELKAAQDGLAREETNLASYTEQLAKGFEHDDALMTAQRDLAGIERKLTNTSGGSRPPHTLPSSDQDDDEAAA